MISVCPIFKNWQMKRKISFNYTSKIIEALHFLCFENLIFNRQFIYTVHNGGGKRVFK